LVRGAGSAVADDRTPYAFTAPVPLCPAGSELTWGRHRPSDGGTRQPL